MIFIDTGAWVARFNKRDQYHQRSLVLWKIINDRRLRVVTSNGVITETITLLSRRISHQAGTAAGEVIYGWKNLSILRSDLVEEMMALAWMKKWEDQDVGFVDCVSFTMMKRQYLSTAFTFDRHFIHAGYRSFDQELSL